MKRYLLKLVTLFGFCAGMLICSNPVQAERMFTDRSLNGIYYFVVTEVREDPIGTPIQHCNGFGTIEFFGDGNAVAVGNDRCDGGVLVINPPEDFTYTVNPDGSFDLFEVPDLVDPSPDLSPTHCQIVQQNRMILCDGTFRDPPPGTFRILSFIAIGVKQ